MKTDKNRKPRLLWANAYCLLDTSSGASISIRQILIELQKIGYEIEIVGATNFDDEIGIIKIKEHLHELKDKKYLNITENYLVHQLAVTKSTYRSEMSHAEVTSWYNLYINRLDVFKPDIVFFYGGQPIDYLVPQEARRRGIPSAAYLVNGNYQGVRWISDVDRIITDTQATANYYKKFGFTPIACGKFIDKSKIYTANRTPRNILFINPSLAKGVGLAIQLAILLEKKRPDITFEIVKSRGDWDVLLKEISTHLGNPRESLTNVLITPHSDDMRPIYARAKLLLVPSLWWESGARVLAEAMLCGVPAIVTDYGGNAEMILDGGIKIKLPTECHDKPFNKLPKAKLFAPLVEKICELYDDEDLYKNYVNKALKVGTLKHEISISTAKINKAFSPLLKLEAGDGDFVQIMKKNHKHGLHILEIVEEKSAQIKIQNLTEELHENEKGVFIDCGGYDGCSALKFIHDNPNFDCFSFEPNPKLWHFYEYIPTTLIKKAVYIHDDLSDFSLDTTDFDGSSLIKEKITDWHGLKINDECPIIRVQCINIINLIKKLKKKYHKIILKLDVEGAEYDILEKLLEFNLIEKIDKIYAEFHWYKCGIPESRHDMIVEKIKNKTKLEDWDGLDFAVIGSNEKIENRKIYVSKKFQNLIKYQNLEF
jgi:FkbM family methyltransferase